DMALPAGRLPDPVTYRGALRRRIHPRGPDHPGLGHHLRRTRVLLRPLRIPVRRIGGGRQRGGRTPAGRKSLRGEPVSRLPAAAPGTQRGAITYEDPESCWDRFEYLGGVSGVAGNVAGERRPDGNPFEGNRSRDYPLPPLERSAGSLMFDKAARELGYHPFPGPAANAS